VVIGGMLGGASGIVFHYLRLDAEAKKEAVRQLPPDQLNRT
jgi:hypothetical protein